MVQQEASEEECWASVPCAYCQGRGTDPWGTQGRCAVCGGKGANPVREPYVTCALCRTTGVHHDRQGFQRRLTCSVCSGKGVVAVHDPVTPCPACRGTGRTSTSEMGLSCTVCSGKGVIGA